MEIFILNCYILVIVNCKYSLSSNVYTYLKVFIELVLSQNFYCMCYYCQKAGKYYPVEVCLITLSSFSDIYWIREVGSDGFVLLTN